MNEHDNTEICFFDVLIIGAGVTGSAAARELSRTNLKVGVLEKEPDVCEGTSKANSGIAHAGYDAMPGTLKAQMNVRGAALLPELAKELHFDYIQNGSLVLCFEEQGRAAIEDLLQRGITNGVRDLRILEREEILEMEPAVNSSVVCALYAPTAAIVCPFGLNLALAQNAAQNGVSFFFNEKADVIEKTERGWRINNRYEASIIINAAGVEADGLHNKTGAAPIHIRPRKGEYFLLDKSAGSLCKATLFQLPSSKGKGVLIAPTVHGNLLVGPTAEFVEEKEDTSTTMEGIEQVRLQAANTIADVPFGSVITSFAGLRAVPESGDFLIEESAPGWIDAAGIESPGLTSAPAIGEKLAGMVCEKLHPQADTSFNPTRKPIVRTKDLPLAKRHELIMNDPAYGRMVCRCEGVSEGEIRDACLGAIPAVSLDGVKRRVRAGMGRCQGGFCMPKVMEIISQTAGIPFEAVGKSGLKSTIIVRKDKEDAAYGTDQ